LVVFGSIGVVCGRSVVTYTDYWLGADAPLFLYFAVLALLLLNLFVAMFLQTVIHESGHLIFGLLSGYRFSSFRIGSFMMLNDGNKMVIRRHSLAGTGGQCLMVPPQMHGGKMPVLLYNLGGPIMNLVTGAVFCALYFAVPAGSPPEPFFIMAAVYGIGFALINGIPMRFAAVDNDGYNAISLEKNPAALQAFWTQLTVNGESAKGIRLKDMPEDWFKMPAKEEMQNSFIAAQAVLCSSRLLDQHRFDEATELLDRLLALDSGLIGIHRNLLACDRIYLELILKNRKEVLDSLLSDAHRKFIKSMRKFPSVIRTEYACALLVQKDIDKAKEFALLFEKVAKSFPYPSDIQAERELMAFANQATKEVQA
jgi:hypothetical protein